MAVFHVINRTTGDRFRCDEGKRVLKAMELVAGAAAAGFARSALLKASSGAER